jgi:hypothetical protein
VRSPVAASREASGSGAGPSSTDLLPPGRNAPRSGERVEPTLGGFDGDAGLGGANADGTGAGSRAAWAPGGRRPNRIDALIDLIATLTPEQPLTGDSALQHQPGSLRAGSKPLLIEGLHVDTGEWEPMRPGQRYSLIQAGVQMANRHGALNAIEYSEFVQSLQAYADALGATPDFPDMLEGVGRARELDHFASEHDAQLGVVLRANSVAWSVGFVHQAAARQGFVPGAVPGRLVLPAAEPGAAPVLVLAFDAQAALAEDPGRASLREVTLSLDVPQTPESIEPFSLWQERGRRLAEDLDATLVDDRGSPITLQAFETIHHELQRIYRALEARDLAAGSALAGRLFS